MKKLLFHRLVIILVASCYIPKTSSQEMNAKMNSYNLQMTSNSDGTMLKFISPETDVQNTYLKTPPKVQVNDIPLPVALVLPALGLSLTLNPKMSIEGELPEYTYTNVKTNPKIVNVEKVLHTNHDVQPIIKHFARPRSHGFMELIDADRDTKGIDNKQYGNFIDDVDTPDGPIFDFDERKLTEKTSRWMENFARKSFEITKNKQFKHPKHRKKLKKKKANSFMGTIETKNSNRKLRNTLRRKDLRRFKQKQKRFFKRR